MSLYLPASRREFFEATKPTITFNMKVSSFNLLKKGLTGMRGNSYSSHEIIPVPILLRLLLSFFRFREAICPAFQNQFATRGLHGARKSACTA